MLLEKMRVHLSSPWEIAETALHIAAVKKRRQRGESTHTPGIIISSDAKACISLPGVTARAISSRRLGSSKKRAQHQVVVEPLTPTLVVTTEHRISIVGVAKDARLRESELLQYSSRPGKTHSFIPTTTIEAAKLPLSEIASTIPAVFDAINDLVYALDRENTRLLCWPAGSGPDQAQTFPLQSAALELNLHHLPTRKSLVYGSCQDGRIFLGESTDALSVMYVPTPSNETANQKIVTTLLRSVKRITGHKRKLNTTEPENLRFYQVTANKNGCIQLHCHEVVLESGDSGLQLSEQSSRTASVTVSKTDLELRDLDQVRSLGLCEDKNAVVISYTLASSLLANKEKENGHLSRKQIKLFSLISLETGSLMASPTELPIDALHSCLISPTALAVGTTRNVLILDLLRGGSLHQESLPDRNYNHGYLMVADESRAHLSVLFVRKDTDKIGVAIPSGNFHGKLKSFSRKPINLATGLSASMMSSRLCFQMSNLMHERTTVTFGCERNGIATRPSAVKVEQDMDQSVSTMLKAYSVILDDPVEVSATLVESAIPVVIDFLCNPPAKTPRSLRNEAALLLRGLLRTKRVFARRHLQPDPSDSRSFERLLQALETTGQGKAKVVYSPVDFILDVFTYCLDVSERQMVASLHYLLCRSSPDDIAVSLREQSGEEENSIRTRYLSSRQINGNSGDNGVHGPNALLATQVLKSGARVLVDRILSYSKINDSFLRRALRDGMDQLELAVLAELLGHKLSLRSLQWLSAISDCFRDLPLESRTVEAMRIQRRIQQELSRTEALLSLRGLLDSHTSRTASKPDRNNTSTQTPPPYQIERLLF